MDCILCLCVCVYGRGRVASDRYAGVQLAKALGAAHVVTAATGAGIAFAKKLGAEAVADYKVGVGRGRQAGRQGMHACTRRGRRHGVQRAD